MYVHVHVYLDFSIDVGVKLMCLPCVFVRVDQNGVMVFRPSPSLIPTVLFSDRKWEPGLWYLLGIHGGKNFVITLLAYNLKYFFCRYYGAIIPSALTVFSMQGFLILNCIIGGQTLASVSDHLDDTLGIVIISIISLVVGCSLR